MNISFKLYETKKQSKIIVRCYKKDLDISQALELYVGPNCWDLESQLFANSPILNEKLLELKKTILSEYNNSYVNGQIINKAWLQSIISNVFHRPNNEKSLVSKDVYVYFSDYAKNWMKENASKWKVNSKQYMNKVLISQYNGAIELFCDYEKEINKKIIIKELSLENLYEFSNYLEEKKYSHSTIHRNTMRIRFFLNRCKEDGLKTSNTYNQRMYVEKNDDIDGIYFNEQEVLTIYQTDFSFDEKLQIAKENLLIGIFTGLRVSDYLTNLDLSNISDDYITIITQKTKTKVVIPVHKIVKEIISSRFGQLPPKMNEYEFGKAIKIIGMICGFDNLVYGKKWNSETKRKEFGYYKRYELFTTHICRRSMASNLYGKIPDNSILSIMGWADQKMLLKYVQTTKKEHANKLKEYWGLD